MDHAPDTSDLVRGAGTLNVWIFARTSYCAHRPPRPAGIRAQSQSGRRSPVHIVVMLIVGLVVGALAKLVTPGQHSHSIVLTILLGVVGSIVAGFIGRSIGWYQNPGDAPGIIASVIGAVLVLLVYHVVVRQRRVAT
jgi:uncharacterized membrane protein YeaQ/YmgE (transglycosylase-associated protein family)